MFRICSLNLTCFIMLSSIRIFFRTSPCELAIDLAVWKWKFHEDSSHESAGGCWATRIYNDPRRTTRNDSSLKIQTNFREKNKIKKILNYKLKFQAFLLFWFTIPRVQSCGLPQEGQLHPALGVLPTSGLGCRLCPSPRSLRTHDLSQPCVYIHISYIIFLYISSFQSLFRLFMADPHQLNCCRATSPNSSRCSGLGQKGKTLTESKRAEAY